MIRRMPRRSQAEVDPRLYRLSPHFVLSDFLGCHSVYARGYANPFVFDDSAGRKIFNAMALCNEALEKILGEFGPLSISYGYISPGLSSHIVKYQDPGKPSHHRWDLGAAADVCVHKWVSGDFPAIIDLYAPKSALGSPIALAHAIDYRDVPYSRLITYSESPYICIAVSDAEVQQGRPRNAFYENRYTGRPKVKPEYIQLSNPAARRRHFQQLQEQGLEHDWRGAGYPTYHGGGFRQYQHRRVSKYTMLSDFLFDLQSISNGAKNIPSLDNDRVLDAFLAAGTVYDELIERWSIPRMSIVGGYVSHTNPYFDPDNDWRSNEITFTVVLPDAPMTASGDPIGVQIKERGDFMDIHIEVDEVLLNTERDDETEE